MKRIILGIFLACGFCFGADQIVGQCSCIPKLTLQEHFQRSDVVFVGKVIEAKKSSQGNTDGQYVAVKFEVKEVWKKDSEKFVTVKELWGSADGFEQNAEWLLYAFKAKDGTLQIVRGCCSRTKLLSVAIKQGDLRGFKKMGERPKRIY
ncbi:MAG TPA: hypothetical protein VGQ55_16130 [Pyrinomonadaceae bacterium]|nr:hypothetical protein [Pyrinomonadaceae bacterium]